MSGTRDLSKNEFTSVVATDSVSITDFGETFSTNGSVFCMTSENVSVGDAKGKGESFTDDVTSSMGESNS